MCRYFALLCMVFFNFSVVLAQPLVNSSEDESLTYSIAGMSLEERVGQLFMVAFQQENGKPVTDVTKAIKAKLQEYHLGGIILFAENFIDIEQTVTLTTD